MTYVWEQDSELLLQEHCLYRRSLVVPDILWLEFELVRLSALQHARS